MNQNTQAKSVSVDQGRDANSSSTQFNWTLSRKESSEEYFEQIVEASSPKEAQIRAITMLTSNEQSCVGDVAEYAPVVAYDKVYFHYLYARLDAIESKLQVCHHNSAGVELAEPIPDKMLEWQLALARALSRGSGGFTEEELGKVLEWATRVHSDASLPSFADEDLLKISFNSLGELLFDVVRIEPVSKD